MAETYDVIVIGGGTAGLVTASGCARLGRKVALVERHALGGDCLWTACVPTKALVASARLASQMRNADAFGLERTEPRFSPAAVMASMRDRQRRIAPHDDPERFRRLGVDVMDGEARIVSRNSIVVGKRTLNGKDIVLATGARTAIPPIDGLTESGWLDHATFLAQDTFPASVLILGGGAIGIEFAQIFARLGVRVIVVESDDEILKTEDPAIVTRLRDLLVREGIELYTGWKVESVRNGVARIANAIGESRELPVDKVFLAAGRRGNTDDLGLEDVGVKIERSWVVADRFLRTSVPRIWACGDVHGAMQFTHAAAYEAVKLVRNLLFPGRSAVDYTNVPWALYTDPEVAHLGMTEPEARAKFGDDVHTQVVELEDVDRAVIDRTPSGFIKFVANRRGRILGAHILAPNASTLIAEVVLARRKGMKVTELAQRISPYPSLADGVQRAASLYYEDLAKGWTGAVAKFVAALSQ